jgi:putative CocE/NonD family hydrolase
MRPSLFLFLALTALPAQTPASTETAGLIQATYTKYEYRIPMRDGVKLFTAVYLPKEESQTYPFLIQRTPYSVAPYGPDRYRPTLGSSPAYVREGFIFVYQDVRGRFQSEGDWIEMTPHKPVKSSRQDVDESTDTYDTIDWLLKNIPRNNGRAGIWGISYPGFYAAAGMIDAHPALKAASPQAPVSDLYMGDDAYHNGAFMLAANFGFYAFFQKQKNPELPAPRQPFNWGTTDGYDFYLNAGSLANLGEKYFRNANPYWEGNLRHPTYDDFWKSRNIRRHLKQIKPAVLTVGGWFDAEDCAGPLESYRMIEANSPPANNHLVMGPWCHGCWTRPGDSLRDIKFHSKTGDFYKEKIELPFFVHHLKEKPAPNLPKAWMFETGANQWRRFDAWPPRHAQPRDLYLHAGGKLSFEPPGETEAFDEYVSDPARPVPYLDSIQNGMANDYMVADQRFAAKRPDVLVYQSDALEEDITLAGPVRPFLHVSTTGTDSDFVVKLIDVYPADYPDPEPNPKGLKMGGYQQLVRGEPFRGKYRKSFETPEPFKPGVMETIEFRMPDVLHTFRRGHRIMVQIQSSWFPLTDRNPQTFTDIPNAKAADFVKATQRVSRSRQRPSKLGLTVLPPVLARP